VGTIAGALFAMIAGVLKVLTGAHEVITTIMLNYVSYDLVTYLVAVGGPMNGNPQAEQSYIIPAGAHLPIIWPGTPLHAGLILALVVAAAMYVLVWRTTWGFELRAVGLNPPAARSAGISIRRVTISTMGVSGALAGLAGAIQVTSLAPYLLPNPFASGFGFDAIAVALIGLGTPVGIVLAALLMGGLRNGATLMEQLAGVNEPFFLVIQATILFFVAAPIVIRRLYFGWPGYLARRSQASGKQSPPGTP
jgi:simple sugar transport system permease protein